MFLIPAGPDLIYHLNQHYRRYGIDYYVDIRLFATFKIWSGKKIV